MERAKLGNESTTAGERLKMALSIVSIGLDVSSVMFGNFFAAIDVAGGVAGLGRNIALNSRQVQRLAWEQRQAVRGMAFKAIPTEPASLAFRKDLR